MQAYKFQAVLPENHRLVLDLPRDIPSGAVEVIVLSGQVEGAGDTPVLPENWRATPLPDEELATLEAFPAFRESHPLRFREIGDDQ
jgi:hypothetical protein